MAASEELARRVVGGRRSCSLTTAVLEEWSRLGTPKQVEYLAGYPRGGEVQPRGLEARDAAQALRAADAQDLRRLRLVGRVVAGGHGARVAARARLRRAQEDLVLMGDVGTGKTHMASALCALACERRLEARFFTASSLVCA